MASHPFAAERALFPILARSAQLSSCSQSALAAPVEAAIQDYLASWRDQGMAWASWGAALDAAKAAFARLIGAQASDIAVMSSVSDLASSFAHSLDFGAGRPGIVLGEIEFPSLGHVWQAQRARGAQVHFVTPDEAGTIGLDGYARAIDARTRLVAISHVAYANAFRHDLAAVAALAHAQGALFLVDAYQSLGACCIDVERDGIDVLVSGTQKYLLGLPGIAFMYVRPGLAEALRPTHTGWFGRVDPFAFDIHRLDYADGARRFDTGTPPFLNAMAAGAGLELILRLGPDRIAAWVEHLSAVAIEAADRHGLDLVSPRAPSAKGPHTAVRVADSAAAERRMAEAGYIVSARGPLIRVAPHFYNSADEVAGAMAALARLS